MKNKRRIILIDKQVQLQIAGRVVAYWSALILCIILPLSFFKTFSEPGSLFVQNVLDVYLKHSPVFFVMLITLPFAVYDSIKVSHRFAGPIYRLRADLAKFKNGESVSIQFRDNDFWTDIPASINEMISRIDDLESLVADELKQDAVSG